MENLNPAEQASPMEPSFLDLYFQEIRKISLQTSDVLPELKTEQGNQKASRLISSNLKLVISVAKQYQNQGLPFPVLIDTGINGLIQAAERFDEKRGFTFITYAVWWIRQAIIHALRENSRIAGLPLNRTSPNNENFKSANI